MRMRRIFSRASRAARQGASKRLGQAVCKPLGALALATLPAAAWAQVQPVVHDCTFTMTCTINGLCNDSAQPIRLVDNGDNLEHHAQDGGIYARLPLLFETDQGWRVFGGKDGRVFATMVSLGPKGEAQYVNLGVNGERNAATSRLVCKVAK